MPSDKEEKEAQKAAEEAAEQAMLVETFKEGEVPEGHKIVEPGAKGAEGTPEVIKAGTWVRLANTEDVPEEVWGHLAAIVYAPVVVVQEGPLSPRPYEAQGEGKFLVRTRDEYSYELELTRDDFASVSSAGRHEILSHG